MDGYWKGSKGKAGNMDMDMVYVYIGEMDFDVLGLCCCAMLFWCVMFWCIVAWFDVRGTPTFLRHGAVRVIAQVGRQGTAEGKGRE
jgi:hypothetical protein